MLLARLEEVQLIWHFKQYGRPLANDTRARNRHLTPLFRGLGDCLTTRDYGLACHSLPLLSCFANTPTPIVSGHAILDTEVIWPLGNLFRGRMTRFNKYGW